MKWLALLLLTTGCATNVVTQVSAMTTYRVATYEHRCQNTGGQYPPECKPCEDVINEAVWQAKVAEINKKQGYLPPAEVADLQRLIKELDKCP